MAGKVEWEREDIYDKIIQGGLIGLIIFTPLPKGSVDVQYFSILELIVFFLLAVWFIKVIRGGGRGNRLRGRGEAHWLKAALILLIAFATFQLIPLPPKILKTISPNTYKNYEELVFLSSNHKAENIVERTHLLQDSYVNTAIPHLKAPKEWHSISLYAHNTREYLFKILGFAGVFFLVLETIRTKTQAKRLIYVIIFTGFVIAALSIIHSYSYNGKALWLWKPISPNAHPYGPFVNKNHFAGYANLIIPLVIGMGMYMAGESPGGIQKGLKGLKSFMFREGLSRIFFFAFASVTMIVALFLSLSRGGMLSFVGALFFMSLMITMRRSAGKRALAIFIISCVIGLITWLGWDPIIERFGTFKDLAKNPSAELRVQIWPDTINMFGDYPVWGTGVGTYVNSFPMYKTVKQHLLFEYAENDYLQMLSEGGIVGAGIAAWFLVIFFLKTIRRWKERHDRFVVYMVLGGLVGTVGFLLASIVNFNFHLPANTLLFAVVAGLTLALVNTRSRGPKETNKGRIECEGKIKKRVFCYIGLVFLLALIIQVFKTWGAEVYYHKAKKIIENKVASNGSAFAFLNKAIALNPINAGYLDFRARQESGQIGKATAADAKKKWANLAMDDLLEAVNLEPTNGYYWMHLGWTAAFQTQEYELAYKAYEKSVKVSPTNYALHKQYALWAFAMASADRKFSPDEGTSPQRISRTFDLTQDKGKLLEIGVREYKTASVLNPSLIKEALWRYSELTQDPDKLKEIVPDERDGKLLIEEVVAERLKYNRR